MSKSSSLISDSSSTFSFSTACTSTAPIEIRQTDDTENDQESHHQPETPIRQKSRLQKGRPITNETLMLSSPLTALIYRLNASGTAEAFPLTSAECGQIPSGEVSVTVRTGNVLRKKRVQGGRPHRLTQQGAEDREVV